MMTTKKVAPPKSVSKSSETQAVEGVSADTVAEAIKEAKALIDGGKTKVEASMAIYRKIENAPQEVVLKAFIEGASLTERGALTYWYNCRRKLKKERFAAAISPPSTPPADKR